MVCHLLRQTAPEFLNIGGFREQCYFIDKTWQKAFLPDIKPENHYSFALQFLKQM